MPSPFRSSAVAAVGSEPTVTGAAEANGQAVALTSPLNEEESAARMERTRKKYVPSPATSNGDAAVWPMEPAPRSRGSRVRERRAARPPADGLAVQLRRRPVGMLAATGFRGGAGVGSSAQLAMMPRMRATQTGWKLSRMPFATPAIRWQ